MICRCVYLLLVIVLLPSRVVFAQSDSDGTDVSGALATIQAKQEFVQSLMQTQQAFPALKARSCKEAVAYVESGDGLFGEWDKAMGKYKAYRGGLDITDKTREELLSDAYWRTSTASDVANDVRYECKLTRHTLALLGGGGLLDNAITISDDFGAKVSLTAVHVYQSIEKGEAVVDLLNSSVDELTIWGMKEAAEKAGYGRVVEAYEALEDTEKYLNTAKEASEYKSTVQLRVHQLDDQMIRFQNDLDAQREKLLAIEALKDAVQTACNKGQSIQTVPEFARGYVAQTPASTMQTAAPPSVTSLPWWAALSSVHPVVRGVKTTQGNSGQAQQNCPTSTDIVGPGASASRCSH